MKYKVLRISFELFKSFFGDGTTTRRFMVENGIPPDAELLQVQNIQVGSVDLIIRSETFPPVPGGEPLPFLTVTIKAVD